MWKIAKNKDLSLLDGKVNENVILMTKYNLVKYYLILLKKYNVSLESSSNFNMKYKDKNMKWNKFEKHPDYITKKKLVVLKLIEAKK